MKNTILSLLLAVFLFPTAALAQDEATKLFPYPVVPDSKVTLSERCNYLVYHFWDRANIKQSFSTVAKLQEAFGDWASFMPYATSDTVHLAIDRFIASVNKADPKKILETAQIAAHWFQGDDAEYRSDELYLPFCKAVASSKKVPQAERLRYEARAKVLESSGLGCRVPNISLTDKDGIKHNLDDVIASRVILLFASPYCYDCTLTKTRLAADYNLSTLIDRGLVKVVCFLDPVEKWKETAESCPESWIVGINPDVDTWFDIEYPSIYYLDGRHKVLAADVEIDSLLAALRLIYDQVNVSEQAAASEEVSVESETGSEGSTEQPE